MPQHALPKLGKQPARQDPRTLQLAKYLSPTLPPPPPQIDHSKAVATWGMMKNDTVGDCTCAAAGHLIMEWTSLAKDPVVPSDASIIDAYAAITGYNPRTGANDNGANELDVLKYWRKTGIDKRKILAYIALEPANHTHVEDSVSLFESCYIGLALPVSAQKQTVWSVPPGGPTGPGAPGSWGGHAVPVVGYDSRGLTVITWGAPKRMTWSFWTAYCDEAYALLSMDMLDAGKAPNGFDLKTLQADLANL